MAEDPKKLAEKPEVSNNKESATGAVSIPDAKNLPDPKAHDGDPLTRPNNLAGDESLCEAVWSWWSKQHQRYKSQSQRYAWVESKKDGEISNLDFADRAWRLAARRDESNSQHQNTLSDVSHSVYYDTVRTNSSALGAIFFGNTIDLPATYEQEVNTDEYDFDIGKKLADRQNALAQYTWDEDKRRSTCKEIILYTEKNANEMVSVEWCQEWGERTERVPTGFNEDGSPKGFKWETKQRMVKAWPTLKRHDLRDCFFDALIDGMDIQQVFGVRELRTIDSLAREYGAGQIKNFDQLTTSAFYNENSQMMEDRQTNSGENTTQGQSGLIETWHVKGWMPIKEKARSKKKNGKGEWKSGQKLMYYWATFAGTPGVNAVCLRLILDPYWQIMGRSNFNLLHSEKDDKGAWHDGNPTRLASIYWQMVTNENQGCDSITKQVNAPHWTNGRIKKRNLVYRQNDLVKVSAGAAYGILPVPDVTQTIAANREFFQKEAERIGGTDKPLNAEAMGSRTSAREAQNVFDTAMMPLDQKAAYFGEDQFFTWLYEWDAQIWRTWSPPKLEIEVTSNEDEPMRVRPAELWGPIKVKVTAVTRFHNTTVKRQEVNALLQGTWAMAEKYSNPDGASLMFRQVYEMAGIEHPEELFKVGDGNFDAEENATRAANLMMDTGEWIEPRANQNHAIWSRVFGEAIAEAGNLGQEDVEDLDNKLRAMRQHKLLHDEFIERAAASAGQPGAAGAPPPQEQAPEQITPEQLSPEAGMAAEAEQLNVQ